jgi:hypothetical protein
MVLRLALLGSVLSLVAQQGCGQQALNTFTNLAMQTAMTVITTVTYVVINQLLAGMFPSV